ncbi:GIY-YIG nuclease family protein [Bacteroidota bacterium]
MFFVYILKSLKSGRFYIGHTKDLARRLGEHNSGIVRSTKAYKPWRIVYTEEFVNREDAFKREVEIKTYKSGEAFKNLIKSEGWQSG